MNQTEVDRLTSLRKEIETLRDLQRKMISILSCDESHISAEIEELLCFITTISISTNFSIYEGFLRIFVHLSVYFNIQQKDEIIDGFYIILRELISKHSLASSFHQSTLFFIFKENKHFLLFLLEEGILDLSYIENEILANDNKNLFIYFIPEIKKMNPNFYREQMTQFYIVEEEINKIYYLQDNEHSERQETKYTIRRKIYSQEEIAKIIQSDDIVQFLNYVARFENFDYNGRIKPSFLENNKDINNYINDGISLLEYSMAFGSINIFRFLWSHQAEYSQESLKYCIIGGNNDIIHILEDGIVNSQNIYAKMSRDIYHLDYDNYIQSIKYYRSDIQDYIRNNNTEMPPLTFSNIFKIFNETHNIDILYDLLYCNGNSHTNNHSQPFEYNKFLKQLEQQNYEEISPILVLFDGEIEISFYFIFVFILQYQNIDLNSISCIYDSISLLFF
ncbi:hypothetical protein TRFO_09923 [Tritrichomonas foetus]|uniref:DUF3447 domain-containing protein n=1 Tax=Tritrichomonas foetus TaxID=1144522 RepID=A0A1J4JFW7_9EUKA|nr:hypothetical protein TRFO_09923 [Tritrichomonas foetus]|eukprot:OHS96531.1 hypothetical protein TRFO_09923 [Tritrichomonas foetus]